MKIGVKAICSYPKQFPRWMPLRFGHGWCFPHEWRISGAASFHERLKRIHFINAALLSVMLQRSQIKNTYKVTYQSTRRRVRSSCSSRMVMDITHAGCCAANVLPKSRTEFTFFINKLCQNPEKVLKMYLNWVISAILNIMEEKKGSPCLWGRQSQRHGVDSSLAWIPVQFCVSSQSHSCWKKITGMNTVMTLLKAHSLVQIIVLILPGPEGYACVPVIR